MTAPIPCELVHTPHSGPCSMIAFRVPNESAPFAEGPMPNRSHRRQLALVFALVVPLAALCRVAHAESELLIGVISPIGDGREIGREHEASIVSAFKGTTGVISSGVRFRLELTRDHGNAERAAERAEELANKGAVAILGPVDSKSIEEVLKKSLEIPVLSATATAPDLASPWFFRMTLSDAERMRQYADTLRREKLAPEPRRVLYDGDSPYGTGLKDGLIRELEIEDADVLTWKELINGGVSDANRNAVRSGEGFSKRGLDLMDPMPATIIVLGSSLNAVPIAQGIDAVLRKRGEDEKKRRFLFVGDDASLRDGAPLGSVTVGEPRIVKKESESDSDIVRVRRSYHRRSKLGSDTMVDTAYEASRVLRRALEEMVKEVAADESGASEILKTKSIQDIRLALRAKLTSLEFESLEPWRTIKIRDGSIEGAPPVPVYRIIRSLDILEVHEPLPYLKVLEISPERPRWLEGSVKVRVLKRQFSEDDELPEIRVARAGAPRRSIEANVNTDGDEVEVTFYPDWFDTYRLDAEPLKMSPRAPEIEVAPPLGYLLAALGAVLGSGLFWLSVTERGGSVSLRRFAIGVVTGLLVAVLDFHREGLPAALTLPSFGSTPNINALMDGLSGGWVGPGIFLLLFGRLFPGGGAGSSGSKPGEKQDPTPRVVKVA